MSKKQAERIEISGEPRKHANIYAALAAFQGELTPMAKSAEVEFPTRNGAVVKFKYTPLGEIMSTIYPLLSKHGLSMRHEVTANGVECIVTHETFEVVPAIMKMSAEGLVSEVAPPTFKNQLRSGVVKIGQGGEMKDTGAAITYARRYTLTMLLGISSEDDKDAELLAESGKNAIQYAYGRARKGIEDAKTVEAIDKAKALLQKDLEALEKGKAPSLGLAKEQYEELLELAGGRRDMMIEGQ